MFVLASLLLKLMDWQSLITQRFPPYHTLTGTLLPPRPPSSTGLTICASNDNTTPYCSWEVPNPAHVVFNHTLLQSPLSHKIDLCSHYGNRKRKKSPLSSSFPLFINPFFINNASMHHFSLTHSLLNCFICLFYSLNLIILGYLLLSFKFSLVKLSLFSSFIYL